MANIGGSGRTSAGSPTRRGNKPSNRYRPGSTGGRGGYGTGHRESSGKGGKGGSGDAAGARALLEAYYNSAGGGGGDYPGGFRTGGGGGGGGYGGYGGYGGGGGYEDYLAKLEAARKQAEMELIAQRDRQIGDINRLQGAALPMIDRFANQYARSIGNVYKDNRAQGAAYGRELAALDKQVSGGLRASAMPMQRDLQAQGAGTAGLQGDLSQYQGMIDAMAGAQGGFNTRLGQVQNQANADFRGLGVSTQQAARSTAVNEGTAARNAVTNQYSEALMRLRMAGLT